MTSPNGPRTQLNLSFGVMAISKFEVIRESVALLMQSAGQAMATMETMCLWLEGQLPSENCGHCVLRQLPGRQTIRG